MKPKTIVAALLLAFVGASVAWLVAKEAGGGRSGGPDAAPVPVPPDPGKPAAPAASLQKVVVYYFYGTARCYTCRKFEEYAGHVLQEDLADAVKAGRLEWRAINVDEPENEHFVRDYELAAKSIVVADLKGGKPARWKNLERIWELVRDREAFESYVRDEVKAYLGDGE